MIVVFITCLILFCVTIALVKEISKDENLAQIKAGYDQVMSKHFSKLEKTENKDIYNQPDYVSSVFKCTSDFNSMLKDGMFSDLDIQCGEVSFKAHKCVLSARSVIFKTMFESPMKENRENLIIIKDVDPETVQAMLEFLYAGMVTSSLTCSTACELLALSDMYELKELKRSCVCTLLCHLSDENALKLLINGNLYDEMLKLYSVQYICSKFEKFQNQAEWEKLQKDNPLLAMELMTAKINYMKLNLS